MPEHIDFDVMIRMLSAVVARIQDAQDNLATLDAATGDGDHGAAMAKIADAISQCLATSGERKLSSLFDEIGWAIMGTDAGSSGPLYGQWFLGMSESCDGIDRIDTAAFATLLDGSISNVRNFTNAQPGDKTMIDALAPAVESAHKSATEQRSLYDALSLVATAAEEGAQKTKDMQATCGRAKHIGERSIGHIDPGAASMSLVLAGLQEGFQNG